jgi:hypothetical protein
MELRKPLSVFIWPLLRRSWVAVGSGMGEDWFLCEYLYEFRLVRSARNLVHGTNTIAAA